MKLVCPFCRSECESDVELAVGQQVVCPFCGKEFSYGKVLVKPKRLITPRMAVGNQRISPATETRKQGSSGFILMIIKAVWALASWFAALIVLFIVGVFVWAYFVKNANNRLEECGESGRQEEDISAEAYVEDSPVEKVYSLKTIRNIKFGSKPIVPLQEGRKSCRLPIKGYYGYKWVGLDYTSAKRLATISLGDDEPNLSKAESDKRLMALIRDCDATWPGIRWNIEPQVVPPCKLFADGKLRDERTRKVIMYFHLMPGDRREGISAVISDGRIAREDGETPFWEPYVK